MVVGGVDVLKGPGLDLLKRVDALEVALAKRTNAAFVFIKPHAVNDAVAAMVKNTFAEQGIAITGEGVLDYKTIDEKMLIDNHYGAPVPRVVSILGETGIRAQLLETSS